MIRRAQTINGIPLAVLSRLRVSKPNPACGRETVNGDRLPLRARGGMTVSNRSFNSILAGGISMHFKQHHCLTWVLLVVVLFLTAPLPCRSGEGPKASAKLVEAQRQAAALMLE